ncbi:probable BOI-related E3 ubiquitin-protein ligase 3 [Magnolia sinica]|uniref:probable BOI-related E3 ubiquitin-protein ligase 3 n=1 Tax=Magnolia sinica TaxID=86752 RepID=UPI00265B144C|nr:probable BOI-related E3 ubiquitin-protein ligase 3 [Magnolia sinica]
MPLYKTLSSLREFSQSPLSICLSLSISLRFQEGFLMAVQAQYPSSNAFRAREGVFDELQLPHRENQNGNLLKGYSNYAVQPQILNGTVFSEPGSELTCNASGSRKRSRVDQMPLPKPQISQFLNKAPEKAAAAGISTGLQLSYEDNRLIESAATSTSGRSAVISPMLLSQDLVSCFYNESIEIDALIRLQNEKLRSGLEETRLSHYRSMLLMLEQKSLKCLREKERELDNARRRNADLEEKVKQMSAENQIWFHMAKNNEAIVSNLRSSLEQVLLHNSATTKEGYGDSSDGLTLVADDAVSCCYEDVEERTDTAQENRALKYRRTCKSCRVNEVSVLLLPCRHLCLCKDCESKMDSCPICMSMRNASLQIFMS